MCISNGGLPRIEGSVTMTVGRDHHVLTGDQFGKKIGKHAREFGLDPSNIDDRTKLVQIITDVYDNPDMVVDGIWRGQGPERSKAATEKMGLLSFI